LIFIILSDMIECIKKLNYSNFQLGNLPSHIIIKLFRNGSIMGKIAEEIICNEIPEFEKAPKSQEDYDIINKKDGSKWEVRCLTKYGANLIPSYQIGKGRKYNEEEFKRKLQKIEGFVIVDIVNFPEINIFKIKSWDAFYIFGKKIKSREELYKKIK